MIDNCNDHKKLCKIQQEISTLIELTRDRSLLDNISDIKHEEPNDKSNNHKSHNANKSDKEPESNVADANLKKIKDNIKLQLNILKSVIAHKMDPIQRAGETIKSNNKDAKKFGRPIKGNNSSNMITALLKMVVNQIKLILSVAITQDSIEHKENSQTQYKPQYLSNMLSNNNHHEQSRNR
ncbi:hypothetical protein [Ehrlichia ruminantium]|nr:hypothetical protein [Ehrlichia ruminantium]